MKGHIHMKYVVNIDTIRIFFGIKKKIFAFNSETLLNSKPLKLTAWGILANLGTRRLRLAEFGRIWWAFSLKPNAFCKLKINSLRKILIVSLVKIKYRFNFIINIDWNGESKEFLRIFWIKWIEPKVSIFLIISIFHESMSNYICVWLFYAF